MEVVSARTGRVESPRKGREGRVGDGEGELWCWKGRVQGGSRERRGGGEVWD